MFFPPEAGIEPLGCYRIGAEPHFHPIIMDTGAWLVPRALLPDPRCVSRTWLPSAPATVATVSGTFQSKPEGMRRGRGFPALRCLIPN